MNGGGAPTVNVDDGLMAVALGEAAHRSIETGLPVEVASLVPGASWQRYAQNARRDASPNYRRSGH